MPGSVPRPVGTDGRRQARTAAAALATGLLLPLISGVTLAAAGTRTSGSSDSPDSSDSPSSSNPPHSAGTPTPLESPGSSGSSDSPDSLQRAFSDAAERYQVPENVLLAVSYLQSRWDGHRGAPSVSGGYGPMHLTDARAARAETYDHYHGQDDARGDTARTHPPVGAGAPSLPAEPPARLRTLGRAAELTGLPAEELRHNPAANVQGGAALLAATQEGLGLPLSQDSADWYGAVASYSGARDAGTAAAFADDVFDLIRTGQGRITDAGQRVVLAAAPRVRADRGQLLRLGLDTHQDNVWAECPSTLSCEWMPAPYEEFPNANGRRDYGNHDKADRPVSQKVEYIVVHDTEATWATTVELVQDPTYVSWHYTLRSADGHVAQHVPTKDVAWHAGNWFFNAKAVGLEHEGFLTTPDAWYTETMYRASARLVKYLAQKHGIPLDRQHILGHDNVPGGSTGSIPGMHTDPGPYWDWQHYFTLLGAPFRDTGGPDGGLVTIRPDYAGHQPVYTRCDSSDSACPPHGSGAVRLHTAPSADAPLVKDIGLHPDGSNSTTGVNDTGARASAGQQFAVAERRGDWTAIWYLGEKAWFHNPADRPTAVGAIGRVVTPKDGLGEVPVYGQAYPEASAYPKDIPVSEVSPLPYTLRSGQTYAVGLQTVGEYYYARTYDPSNHRVVRGGESYYQIQFGHRVAFVKAADVMLLPSSG